MPYNVLYRKLIETLKRFNLSEDDIFYSDYVAEKNMFCLSMQNRIYLPEWRILHEFWCNTGFNLEFVH